MASITYLLLVTWFTVTGASSYQVEFGSRDNCVRAMEALQGEQDRLERRVADMFQSGMGSEQMPEMAPFSQMFGPMMKMMQSGAQPYVSAVCVER